MADAGVTVNVDAMVRSWLRSGLADLLVEFVPDPANDRCLADADEATAQANRAAYERGWEEVVGGESPSRSPRGALVRLKRPDDTAAIEFWLNTYADALSALGQHGRLTGPQRRPTWPEWTNGTRRERQPAAFVFFPTDPARHLDGGTDASPGLWSAQEAPTQTAITEVASWVSMDDADLTIKLGAFGFAGGHDSIPHLLQEGLATEQRAGVQALHRYSPRARVAGFFPPNGMILNSLDKDRFNADLLAERIAVAARLAPTTSVTFFAKTTATSTSGTLDMEGIRPPPPQSRSYWVKHSHLHATHTFDAFGVQILTSQHLERARDLSAWDVTEVSPGRYLVQSKDVTAWYATDAPPMDLVQQARSDFGDMIVG